MLKFILFTIMCTLTLSAIISDIRNLIVGNFDKWSSDFGKLYASANQEAYRKAIFQNNLNKINRHNADKTQTYKMGINQFTDLTVDEFEATYSNSFKLQANDTMPKAVATIPPSKDTRALQAIADIDWTKSGVVTGIRHQGKCSSCYAFATIAVTESMFLIRNKTLSSTSFDLSEQQLVDCGKYINKFIPRNQTGFKLNGCFSGSPTNALKYIQKFGISSETQYPYRAKQAYFCNKNSGSFKITKINYAKGCIDIQTALKTAPVAVVVICQNWSSYSSGIFNNCGQTFSCTHSVLLVGIVSGNWKVKNSWGVKWGESGYMRLPPGNTCGICTFDGVFPQ